MQKIELLFESYNMAVEGAYNKIFTSNSPEEIYKLKEDMAAEYVSKALDQWEQASLESLDGITPFEYFDRLPDLDSAIEHFKAGAKLCDDKLPSLLIKKLESYGREAVDVLIAIATDQALLESEEGHLVAIMAIKTLGELKADSAVKALVDLLKTCKAADEFIMEEIEAALVNIGKASLEYLMLSLNEVQDIDYRYEYLLSALSKIGSQSPAEDLFNCIRSAFRRMNNKMMGAIYLGQYGDGRAIPALRGYVERNMATIDRETFYEIKSSVEKLGGNMDDLVLKYKK